MIEELAREENVEVRFIEAIYFRKPVVINRYDIFVEDIEPKGFDLAVINGFMTRDVAKKVQRLLSEPDYRERVVEHNYKLARHYYSHTTLRRLLRMVINSLTGWSPSAR